MRPNHSYPEIYKKIGSEANLYLSVHNYPDTSMVAYLMNEHRKLTQGNWNIAPFIPYESRLLHVHVFWFCHQSYLELDIHVVEDAYEDCVGHNSNKDNDREDPGLWKTLAINSFGKIYKKEDWLLPFRKDFPWDSKSAKNYTYLDSWFTIVTM